MDPSSLCSVIQYLSEVRLRLEREKILLRKVQYKFFLPSKVQGNGKKNKKQKIIKILNFYQWDVFRPKEKEPMQEIMKT